MEYNKLYFNLFKELFIHFYGTVMNKIKALTNYSPSEFIRKVRMNEAAILLKSKKYTVSEVSDMLGFGDPKYFTDSFKKYFDVPPSVYMKQN